MNSEPSPRQTDQAAPDFGESLQAGERSPAPYAASAIPTRGREFAEAECHNRGPFQRDRDRVIHASPFRRLTYKTQVFLFHEGDHFRTRLTHSLEVAQIARTLARQLRLDEDLAEVLALAHDLGHSPFGHAGERALDEMMSNYGGFDHNAQSIRIVTRLEQKYRDFDGLNLSWETLEGLAKHNGPVTDKSAAVARATRGLEQWKSLELESFASAEAQVAALADDIAYVNHDIDDGLRAGLLKLADLKDAPLVGPLIDAISTQNLSAPIPDTETNEGARLKPASTPSGKSTYDPAQDYVEESRAIYQVNRQLISLLVADCVTCSRENLRALNPHHPKDIRHAGVPVVAFSQPVHRDLLALKKFLFERVYRHTKVMTVMERAQNVVRDLFSTYLDNPQQMHARWAAAASANLDPRKKARLVSDFVAGMTDRLALMEHGRLFDGPTDLR